MTYEEQGLIPQIRFPSVNGNTVVGCRNSLLTNSEDRASSGIVCFAREKNGELQQVFADRVNRDAPEPMGVYEYIIPEHHQRLLDGRYVLFYQPHASQLIQCIDTVTGEYWPEFLNLEMNCLRQHPAVECLDEYMVTDMDIAPSGKQVMFAVCGEGYETQILFYRFDQQAFWMSEAAADLMRAIWGIQWTEDETVVEIIDMERSIYRFRVMDQSAIWLREESSLPSRHQ